MTRRVGRDVKGVHGNLHALLAAGLLDRTANGRVVFPYDAVKVEFTVGAGREEVQGRLKEGNKRQGG